MNEETLIQSTLETLISTLFGNSERSISVHRMPNDSFKAYLTSPDPIFLAQLIGPVRFEKCVNCNNEKDVRGETINSIKRLFRIWAIRNKIRVDVWVERAPIKKLIN